MKIGIISINAHTKTLNFACPLHTYAFQQFLFSNGIDCTIIDYMPAYYPQTYTPDYPLRWYFKHNNGIFYSINQTVPESLTTEAEKQDWETKHRKKLFTMEKYEKLYNVWPRRFRKFQKFMDSHYYITSESYHHKTLDENDPGFDCYICATDVIWQYVAGTGFDRGFLLRARTMEGKAKIGYSVSRGVYKGWSDDIVQQFIEYTSDYEAISAREPSFAEHISEMLGKEIPTVLDPVLLMDRDFWHKLAFPPRTDEKYVLLYTVMEKAADSVRTAIRFSRDKGLKLIVLSAYEGNQAIPADTDCDISYDVGPEEWLGYIENAEYIITNSYHCCAFSIIFEKQFYVGTRNGDKVGNILDIFGLSHRRFTRGNDCTLSDDVIDYGAVRPILEERRRFSGEVILKAIHDVEQKYGYENSILPKKPYNVIYSSTVKNTDIKYRWFLGDDYKKKTEKNCLKLQPRMAVKGEEGFTLEKHPFKYKNHTFMGWYGKSILKNIPKWYCTDGQFHTAPEICYNEDVDVYLFKDGEATDAFAANRLMNGSDFYLDAVWRRNSDGKITPDIRSILSSAAKKYRSASK